MTDVMEMQFCIGDSIGMEFAVGRREDPGGGSGSSVCGAACLMPAAVIISGEPVCGIAELTEQEGY